MMFPRCTRCGCKVAVAGLACACTFAAVHPQNLCGQFDRDTVSCTKFALEPPHGPHEEGPYNAPWRVLRVSASPVGSSGTATLTVSISSGSWTILR
jgi:hypothetical protein